MLIGIDASRAVTTQRTGTEAYAYYLIQALLPLAAAQGHQIRLYFNQAPPPDFFAFPELERQVEQVVIPSPRLWTHGRLAWELWQNPPDVFFTPAHVIPFTYRGAAVATVHDLGYHIFPEAHPWAQRAYLKWSTRHNCRRSHTVLADSLATKQDLHRFYGVAPEKVAVVYPSIDPTLRPVRDQKEITAVLRRHNITQPYLLYLGTLQPRKNLVRLIDAYQQSGVSHQLVLAGRVGWLAQEILEKVVRCQVPSDSKLKAHSLIPNPQSPIPNPQSPKIHLPGYIPEADKAALLSGATALLFPSLYEGFGFPVLEGMACETAVLCSNSSSLVEVAGDATYLVDPEDTAAIAHGISALCEDSELRQRLIKRGKDNVKRFQWETAASQTLQALSSAVGW